MASSYRSRVTIAAVVSAALWAVLVVYAALVAHDFYRTVDHLVYISVDDGLSNEAYTLATQGRYGFLASPVLFGIERHHGEFSYGPWYFYLAGGLIWLFGYSLTLVRSIHLWVMFGTVVLASAWFRGPGRAAAATIFTLAALYAFGANQWPMARPDSMVSLFAVVLIVCAGLGLTRTGARYWFGAGLAASCAAFTHLIAFSLVLSSLFLFGVGAMRRWLEADDRALAARGLAASFSALAAGGLLGAAMFYSAFGFRFGDQLRLFASYRALVASPESYATVIGRHFAMAFGYLSAEMQMGVWALIAAAWIMVGSSRLLSSESRTLVYGYLLPPITVWSGYLISNAWYSNQHKGYAILHDVMMSWVLASIVWVAVHLASRRTSNLARALPACAGILVFAIGVRQIEAHLEGSAERVAAAHRWVSIADYTDHVLSHVPARSTAWGSVMYGIETPDRLQLIQVAEGLVLMPRVDISRRAALAPDYLLWGYPEERDNTLIVMRGGDSLLGRFAQLTDGAQYRVASLVAASPYGVTRVYAKTEARGDRAAPLPDVSIFDADAQRWSSRIGSAIPIAFSPITPAEFAIGYENTPRFARAAHTVSADVPAGRYLIRVGIAPGAGTTKHRLLAAVSREQYHQRIGELGPQGDFTSYFARDRQVVMVSIHAGGPLEISQFDDGAGAGIDAVSIFPVEALLDPGETPGILALPAPASWTPTIGVRAIALGASGVEVAGDTSRFGYQLTSPRIAGEAGDRVRLHVDMTVNQGRVCLGILNGARATWLIAPDQPRTDVTFRLDETRGFYVVPANCNDAEAGNPATRLTVAGGRYTVEPAALYTDRFMNAVDVKPVDPADADISGVTAGLLVAPAGLKVTRLLLDAPVEPVLPLDVMFQAKIAQANGDGWTISGRAESAYSYLVQSKPRPFDKDTRVIMTGTIEKGGLTIGLLNKNQWAVQVNVTEPGPFTVVLAAPKNGAYSILAANDLQSGTLDTSIAITSLGVAQAR